MRWLAVLSAFAALLVASTTAHADAGIVNQASTTDPSGDSGTGVDLSGMTLTTYNDGTITFAVQMANRNYLQPGETVQIFVDVDADGKADLNLSVWQNFSPSYLDRWTGLDWTDIRQLPELVQTPGMISEHISLGELQSAAGVPLGSTIRVRVASYTVDPSTNANIDNDWMPGPTTAFPFPLKAIASTTTTTTTAPTTTTTAGSPTTGSKLPVSIQVDSPGLVHAGKDARLKIVLQSAAGPTRLFKVCTSATGVPHPTQCRSVHATGKTPVPFTITYRLTKPGANFISIAANAGSATATGTAVVRVSKA